MRIAVFARSTTEHFETGGMETHLENLVEGLSAKKHQVVVITTSMHNSYMRAYIKYVDYIYIEKTTHGLRPLTFWEKLFSWAGVLNRGEEKEGRRNFYRESRRTFEKIHKDKPFDLILSQSTMARGILRSRMAKNLPLVAVIHGTIKSEIKNRYKNNKTIKNWIRFWIVDLPVWYVELYTSNRRFFKRCAKIVAVSETLKTQFAFDHPQLIDKVQVIANGVNETIFAPDIKNQHKSKKFTILYVGRMDREKGVDLIIRVAKQLKDLKKYKFEIQLIGSGISSHIKELKDLVAKLKVQDYVQFIGAIPNRDLPEYYQNANVFLFPSRRVEGHPMTLSEAFCCGLPIIATKSGGLVEQIEDKYNGYLVEVDDLQAIVNKLRELMDNPANLKKLSEQAYKTGITKYSRSFMIKQYTRLFRKVYKDTKS